MQQTAQLWCFEMNRASAEIKLGAQDDDEFVTYVADDLEALSWALKPDTPSRGGLIRGQEALLMIYLSLPGNSEQDTDWCSPIFDALESGVDIFLKEKLEEKIKTGVTEDSLVQYGLLQEGITNLLNDQICGLFDGLTGTAELHHSVLSPDRGRLPIDKSQLVRAYQSIAFEILKTASIDSSLNNAAIESLISQAYEFTKAKQLIVAKRQGMQADPLGLEKANKLLETDVAQLVTNLSLLAGILQHRS